MITWNTIGAEPTEAEAAAISAALAVLVEAPSIHESALTSERSLWYDSDRLVIQGLNPARTGVTPRWHTIERLRQRAAGGFHGIIGL